jgi:hypothetical protein
VAGSDVRLGWGFCPSRLRRVLPVAGDRH